MGIVFRAREVALDREVALKVLALDPVLAPDAYARFEREAKLAARLDHPSIVPIFSVGGGKGIAYYTMRLIRGGNVEDLIEAGRPLDLHRATAILREVASALDYAHGRGVVHRDIKPANILIGDTGHASVADFGIARALGQSGEVTGMAIIGSPPYMSPEQWRGDELDGRADQYALGVVAFEMITGRRPFDSPRVQDLLNLHIAGEIPDVSTLRPGIDPGIGAAIRRALAKDSSQRFPSNTAFVEALAGRRPVTAVHRVSRGATLPPSKRVKKRRVLLPLAMVAMLGCVTAFAVPQSRPHAMHWWTIARDQAYATGQEIATNAGFATFVIGAVAPPVGAESTLAVVNSDSLDRVIAEMRADTTSSVSSLISETGVTLAVTPDTLDRAPLVTEGPKPALPGGYRRTLPDPGYVRVTYIGGIAAVRIDGKTYGFTPQVIALDSGAHFVSLNSNAYAPSQIEVTVVPRDTAIAAFKVPATAAKRPDSAASPTPPPPGAGAPPPAVPPL
jgi:serine/threonine protein kinase